MYNIIKSKRKTLAISIKYDGTITIRVPLKTSQKQIDEFIAKYAVWIKNKLQQLNLSKQDNQSVIYYLGYTYELRSVDNNKLILFSETNQITVDVTKEQLLVWYKRQSLDLVLPILTDYAAKYNLSYRQVKITLAKQRWGSCNSLGNLAFSYRLAMLPIEIIQYVVAHELAHLKHLNHSKDFWQFVAVLYPDYKKAHGWFKQNKCQLFNSVI